MAATPLQPYIQIRQAYVGSPVEESTNDLLDYEIDDPTSAIGTMMVEVLQDSLFGSLALEAVGGPDGGGPLVPRIVEFSLSNGVGLGFDCRMLVEEVTLTLDEGGTRGVKISGDNLGTGYALVGIDKVGFFDQPLQKVLTADPATNPIIRGPGVLGAGTPNPTRKGIMMTVPGGNDLFKFTTVVDPAIADIPVTSETLADRSLRALRTVMARVAGQYIAGDYAYPGDRSTFVIDCSDAGLNLGGVSQSIVCGHVGKDPFLTIKASDDQALDETLYLRPVDATPVSLSTKDMTAQTSYIGGQSSHGIPPGARVTGILTVNNVHDSTAFTWDASLPIFGIRDDNQKSGFVAFYPHDEDLHSFSQPLAVNDVKYDETTNTLYVAHDNGVAFRDARPLIGPPVFAPLGGLTSLVKEIQIDAGVVVAWVEDQGPGLSGLYRFPARTGDTSGDTLGFSGWSGIHGQGKLVGFYYVAATDTVVVADANDPAAVAVYSAASLVTSTGTRVPTPNGAAVIGIDPLPGGCAIRTTAGASGLYYLANGSLVMEDMNPDNSLVDVTGQPVGVNIIWPFFDGADTLNGETVAYLAGTDAGVFATANPAGSGWHTVCGENGLQGTNITHIAAGRDVTSLGLAQSRIYVGNDSSVYASYDGLESVEDILNLPVSGLPFWMELYRELYGTYPDNNVTALGNVPSGADLGGTGTVAAIPPTNEHAMASGNIYARRRTEVGAPVTRIYDTLTKVPFKTIDYGEMPDIATSSLIGPLTASTLSVLAMKRGLFQEQLKKLTTTVRTQFGTQEAAGRRLRPTHMVALDFTIPGVCDYNGTRLYVTRRRLTPGSGGSCNLDLELSNRVIPPLDQVTIGQDLLFTQTRMLRAQAKVR